MHTCFAVCAPGLEPFLWRELAELGLVQGDLPQGGAAPPGGIEFQGDLRALYRANLCLRTATRVLLRLSTIQARSLDQLRDKVGRMPWKHYLFPGQPITVRATSHRSQLYHTDAVAERVVQGISDRLGAATPLARRGDDDDPADPVPLVVVRVVGERCTISVDTSGAPLHRRGYRQVTAKAPLRETLAAGIILASGWDATAPLVDPFCGSGTIPIEAALLALRIAPGLRRTFAFQDWPTFDAALWGEVRSEAETRRDSAPPPPLLVGSDRDAGAVQAARANAERAGVAHHITFRESVISTFTPPSGTGWVVTNPPYGKRITGKKDLRNLYARFGDVLRERCPAWRVTLLAANPQLTHSLALPFEEEIPLRNGGLRVRLVSTRVPGGYATQW